MLSQLPARIPQSPQESRHAMFCRLFSIALLGIAPSVVLAADTHVLLVGAPADHPFGSHMYDFECRLLAKCLEQRRDIRATVVPQWPPTEDQLARAQAIVFYSNPAGSALLSPKQRHRFHQLMIQGVGMVAIHWGTGVGYGKISDVPANRALFAYWLGGWFRRPPCGIHIGRASLTHLDKRHPILRGVREEGIRDEFYLRPVLDPRAKPLLQVRVDGTDHVVGWTLQRKPGRSVGITLGHFHDNFTRDNFRRLLTNSILWAANVEVPQRGARVQMKPGDLTLPPAPKNAQ